MRPERVNEWPNSMTDIWWWWWWWYNTVSEVYNFIPSVCFRLQYISYNKCKIFSLVIRWIIPLAMHVKSVVINSHTHTHTYIYIYIYFLAQQSLVDQGSFIIEAKLSHSYRQTTLDRTPPGEWSARHRDLYLTAHNIYQRQIPMPSVGFEPAGKRSHIYTLYRASTETGWCFTHSKYEICKTANVCK